MAISAWTWRTWDKPSTVKRWSHDNSIDFLADYAGISREAFMEMNPIEYVHKIGFLQQGLTLFPKSVWKSYSGPARNTHAYLFRYY